MCHLTFSRSDGAIFEKAESCQLSHSGPEPAALVWPSTKLLGGELGTERGRELVPKQQSQKGLRPLIFMLLTSLPVRETFGRDFYRRSS